MVLEKEILRFMHYYNMKLSIPEIFESMLSNTIVDDKQNYKRN